ncbi:MAG: response regulator [Candidatus Omnitrophica bacterium]|nr:response regulator [Candidatus Omnitrophota bacterium]
MLANFATERVLRDTKGLKVIEFVSKGYEFHRAAGLIRESLRAYQQEQRKVAKKGEKKTILIVDDEPELRRALTIRLEASNYQVLTASDGEEALNKMREESPDLIILDIMLPKMDGFKVCRLFKFDPQYKGIPVIMLTARAQKEDESTGMETGADEYITKPFETESLLAKVKEHLGK